MCSFIGSECNRPVAQRPISFHISTRSDLSRRMCITSCLIKWKAMTCDRNRTTLSSENRISRNYSTKTSREWTPAQAHRYTIITRCLSSANRNRNRHSASQLAIEMKNLMKNLLPRLLIEHWCRLEFQSITFLFYFYI